MDVPIYSRGFVFRIFAIMMIGRFRPSFRYRGARAMIQQQCLRCGQTLNIPDEYLGKEGRCNKCGARIFVGSARKVDGAGNKSAAWSPVSTVVAGIMGFLLLVLGADTAMVPFAGLLAFPAMITGVLLLSVLSMRAGSSSSKMRTFCTVFGLSVSASSLLALTGGLLMLVASSMTPFGYFYHVGEGPARITPWAFYAKIDRTHSVYLPFMWLFGPTLLTAAAALRRISLVGLICLWIALFAVFPAIALSFPLLVRLLNLPLYN
jgi:DNA-directed RNA polymerase subunit RPC12/RpoP